MRRRATEVQFAWATGDQLVEAGSWAPALFCGDAARITFAPYRGLSLAELDAEVIEGYRAPGPAEADRDRVADHPRYRLANVGRMALEPGPEHGSPPKVQGRWCALPGDVIVTKVLPIRAAVVSERAHRHPVDATCLIVRNLELREGAWLALCLNQDAYDDHVARGQVMPRLSASTLRELRLPEPPLELAAHLPDLVAWLDRRAEAAAALGQVQVEANELADHAAASAGFDPGAKLTAGSWVPPHALDGATWLPSNTFARFAAGRLAAAGWPTLRDLGHLERGARLDPEEAPGTAAGEDLPLRLAAAGDDVLSVRLSDVGTDLYIRSELEPITPTLVRRHRAAPLAPGEVLVSGDFSATPRSAFVDARVPARAHPFDHWQRLSFRAFPAAWALALTTPPVARQLRMRAYGTVIAHVLLDDLLSVHLPPVPIEQLAAWDRAVAKHHEVRRELDAMWTHLWPALVELFDRAHPPLGSGHGRVQGSARIGGTP